MRRRLVSAWISTVVSLSLVLLLVGVGTLLVVNAREVGNYFKENLQINVLLKEQVTEEEALSYESKVAAIPGVRATRYISREQGKEEMARLLGEDFLSVFESAPVPISIDVNLEAGYVSKDSLEVVKASLAQSPLVEEVVYQMSLVDALNQNLQRISLALTLMVAVLLFISFVLIGNTVRLDLFNRRFSIYTMHLVGATRAYIRAPFVGRAALQGVFAALDSLLLTMGVMLLVGLGVATLSTFVVVNRLVGYNRDQLYAY